MEHALSIKIKTGKHMKKVLVGFVLLFTVFSTYAQQITVRSDQAEDVDYSKYKTFNWASHVSNELDAGIYFLNDLILKAQIREAVKAELMGLGYELTENADQANLIVNFRVFDQPVTLKGMEGYGDNYWGETNYAGISETVSHDVEAGTLLLSLADRESGKVVWQGFASGLIDNNRFIKDEVKISEAVNLIFDEFNQRAKEYTKK
jgi:hypothetical protein